MFTSNLSISEFVLTTAAGIIPLRQVGGNSAYQIQWQYVLNPQQTGEIKALMRPVLEVYLAALVRMRHQAEKLGAHAVVGVRLEQTRHYPSIWTRDNVLEVKVTGTAIALPGTLRPEKPALCSLSGQEYFLLRQAGYLPIGIAFGNSVYQQLSQGRKLFDSSSQRSIFDLKNINPNQERTDYTRGFMTARDLALKRMKGEGSYLGAEEIVGVTVRHRTRLFGEENPNLFIEFIAFGTGIVSSRAALPSVDYRVSLTDGF